MANITSFFEDWFNKFEQTRGISCAPELKEMFREAWKDGYNIGYSDRYKLDNSDYGPYLDPGHGR
jgi:hypothetical protein